MAHVRAAAGIPQLVEGLEALRAREGLDLELLLLVEAHGRAGAAGTPARTWVRAVRPGPEAGPGAAALEALRGCGGDVLVAMDADAHPPEAIPALLRALDQGAELALGSRRGAGGLLRRLGGRVAALPAAPLTPARDPLTGFFALRRETLERGRELNPVGEHLALELLVRCGCRRVAEVPVAPLGRRPGRRGRSLRERLRYLQHLRRLYIFRFGVWSHLLQFLVVGATGLAVNLAALTALLALGVGDRGAVVLSIALSMVWNFLLNRRFSFSYARQQSILRQFAGFVAACSVGAVVNYAVTMWAWEAFRFKQPAAVLGVAAGTLFNFVASRYLVFRRTRGGAPPAAG